ncbi:flippase [Nodosilinea sp. P-1105]|uniref:flippase n=1 Tax=Nodosilinea sp. P-1105 TaxID=2546229 RepID=UPI00146A9B16|nr:flippase [Nodosilinea sp. P-1105]NMF82940.1 flippase [Nodosilinea sp. P-1105]
MKILRKYRFTKLEKDDGLGNFLAKASSGTFLLMTFSSGVGYISSIFLAKILGVESFGTYSYLLTLLSLVQIPTEFGLPTLAPREVSVYESQQNWKYLRGFIIWSHIHILIASVLVGLLFFYFSYRISPEWLISLDNKNLIIIIACLPPLAVSNLGSAILRGRNKILESQLPITFIKPVLLLTLLILAYWWLGDQFGLLHVLCSFLFATYISFLCNLFLVFFNLPQDLRRFSPKYKVKKWLRFATPMVLATIMFVINNQMDTVMLGALSNSAEIGVYSISGKLSGLITFVLVAVNMSIGPTFARLHASGEQQSLQRLFTKSNRIIFCVSLLIGTFIIMCGPWIFLILGDSYAIGNSTLIILSMTNIVNSFFGSVGLLLIMTGYQDWVATSLIVSSIVNFGLNISMIPIYGSLGAAVATLSSTLVWNLILGCIAYWKLRIVSSPLARGSGSYR